MLVDSHCHLNYLDDPQSALSYARERGVSTCLCIGVDQKSIEDVLAYGRTVPGVWATVGEHPGSCSGDAAWVDAYLDLPFVVAAGEMGLDYHYETAAQQQALQRNTFRQQMTFAQAHNLPVVIHTRAAIDDTLQILSEFPQVTGVLHCFTETWDMASQAIDMGYYVSISGIVTFKNADNVREVARQVPAERLLIETDAPWLAPAPHRGKQNQPGYVADTAQYLADLLDRDVDELVAQTSNNFYQLFDRADPQQVLV